MATSDAPGRFTQLEWKDKELPPIDGLETNDPLPETTRALQSIKPRISNLELYMKNAKDHFNLQPTLLLMNMPPCTRARWKWVT
ncbi:unnamed protein product [Didymodactylos carnosus]|uniref:Uncharacterized protein n=1 Tax=Didymodactylos carnosus TaxID=1234261 RepID=A0A8S2FG93_9BILA|nr:unnamed protein product [Didymodactylos carnosus]CAF4251755.1 unnamed protein product [Didymodactylos carnosus]